MLTNPELQLIWWGIIGLVLILFALTAGFDLGIGALLPIIGRTNADRRIMLNVIGPTWDGNQVWLIIAGGALFVIWPMVYAAVFSGFYGLLFVLLGGLYMRPVGFEWRAKINNPTWRAWWDFALCIGGIIPAVAIGCLIGNLMKGAPFHYDTMHRFFYTGGFWSLFTPFTLLIGLVTLCMFMMHGAVYLQVRTQDAIARRARNVAICVSLCFLIALFFAGWIADASLSGFLFNAGNIQLVRGAFFSNFKAFPAYWLGPVLAVLGVFIVIVWSFIRRPAFAFVGSTVAIVGTILTFGIAMFPFILPSTTHVLDSLTIWNATSAPNTLSSMLVATCILVPIILLYTTWVYRKIWGRVTASDIEQEGHHLY